MIWFLNELRLWPRELLAFFLMWAISLGMNGSGKTR